LHPAAAARRNLVRSFHRICAAHGLRDIKVHHLRHTTATLLKNLGVPARDAQIILGRSRLAITLEIYTHEDRQAQREALGRISEALGHDSELPPAAEADDEADESDGG
jgi:integrase